MTTDLNKTLEKDANGRLIDLYNIINNEPINGVEGKKLKELLNLSRKGKKNFRGQTYIYTQLKHCSKSGMSRSISMYVIIKGDIQRLDYWYIKASGSKFDDKNGGVKIGGCGMDMGFAMVDHMMYYAFGRTDWQDKFIQTWI